MGKYMLMRKIKINALKLVQEQIEQAYLDMQRTINHSSWYHYNEVFHHYLRVRNNLIKR